MDQVLLAHLLRRTEYVARPARMAALAAATVDEAVDDILNVTVPVALPAYLEWDIEGEGYDQYVYATQWWIDRMVDSARPMLEKMTFFWHGHFCSSWDKVGSTRAMMQQNKLFRDSAFGNFRQLTQTMSVQPAMLFYLDNLDNVKTSPNQNFARELMELFTIGVGNYTENDVTAAARAWTGHGIDWDTYEYEFHGWDHDYNAKSFMGVSRTWDGPQIIDYLLQENTTTKMIACRFLTKKLWERFAYQNPAQPLVDELAQVLYDADFEVKPWVRAMLVHPEFYSVTAQQGLVRSPVEFVVACMFYTGYRSATLNPQWSLDSMGQEPYNPPNVAGWKTNSYWLSTSVMGARADFARSITWRLRDNSANDFAKGRTPEQAVDYLDDWFALDLAPTTRQAFLDYIAVQRQNEPWIGWWESTNLLTMAMLTPEFQLA
ncbi:MAG TPA: DUF1800 domain-containing protein [Ilumatobacteraceae bacterium]|nr:DUF1800 domain-containing protein [Ilumatobacteraceae bacterium]